MNRCQQQHLVVDYFFNELNKIQRAEFERHLANCQVCHESYTALSEIAPLIKKQQRADPNNRLFRQYHRNLRKMFSTSNGISAAVSKIGRFLFSNPPIPVRIAEAAALIIIGIFIGRLTFWESPATTHINPDKYAEVMEPTAGEVLMKNYLQETEMILLDVANLNPVEYEQFLIHLKQFAIYKSLLQKTILCREQAQELNNEKLLTLIDEIEPILLELSNIENETLNETLAEIRSQIKESHLLLELKAISLEKI